MIEFTSQEFATMLGSIEYSKQRVREAPGTPYNVRQENLARLEECKKKLQQLRDSKK